MLLWARTERQLLLLDLSGARDPSEAAPGSRAPSVDKLALLDLADPDPIRSRLRRADTADGRLTRSELIALATTDGLGELDAPTLTLLAGALGRSGEVEAWEAVCRHAQPLFPTDFQLLSQCAYNLRRSERWSESARLYSMLVALRPGIAGLWQSLGTTLKASGRPEEAAAVLERLKALESRDGAIAGSPDP